MKKTVALAALLLIILVVSAQASITLYTPTAGDASYTWNSRYGSIGYTTGETTMGVYLSMGGTYGNDYTVSIFEVPIAELAGLSLTSAMLEVDSLGFGTNYYYGSASIGWLNTGSSTLTGDVVADGMGPASTGRPGGFTIYNSDLPSTTGTNSFDVLTYVQQDLAAGRSFSTFVMSGSRETYGSIYTAESGFGPRIVAEAVPEVVPEPSSLAVFGSGLIGLAGFLRRRK